MPAKDPRTAQNHQHRPQKRPKTSNIGAKSGRSGAALAAYVGGLGRSWDGLGSLPLVLAPGKGSCLERDPASGPGR